MIVGYINIKTIVEKLYRDLQINTEIPFDDCVEWVAESLAFIGAFGQFKSMSTTLTVENFKVKVPCDLYKLSDISYCNQPIYWSGNSVATNYFCDDCQIPTCNDVPCRNTFYINDYYIYTSFEEGDICITYLAFPVDEDGLPMVPDEVHYLKACTAYVTKMLDYQDWRKGRVPDKVYQESKLDWEFYVNAARGAANMPSLGELEALKNIVVRLIPNQNGYRDIFRNTTVEERRKLH